MTWICKICHEPNDILTRLIENVGLDNGICAVCPRCIAVHQWDAPTDAWTVLTKEALEALPPRQLSIIKRTLAVLSEYRKTHQH